MKILDLINEAETDKTKNARHRKDLDDLEREIRKSGSMDKETEKAINAKRRELAANKAKMAESSTTTSALAIAPAGVGAMQSRNPDGTAKNALDSDVNLLGSKKKRKKRKK